MDTTPSFWELLCHHATQTPHDICVQTPIRQYSFLDIQQMVDSLSSIHTFPKGSLLGIQCANSVDTMVWVLLCSKHDWIFSILPHTCPEMSIDPIAELQANIHIYNGVVRHISPTIQNIHASARAIFYSSGSIRSKGIVHTETALVHCAQEMAEYLAIRTHDRSLLTLDMAFHYGFSVWSSALSAGACIQIPRSILPSDIIHSIEHDAITIVASVPHHWASISKLLHREQTIFSSPIRLICAGDACPTEILSLLQSIFSHSTIHLLYGCTETLRSCHHVWKPTDPEFILGTPLPSVHLTNLPYQEDDIQSNPPYQELYILEHSSPTVLLGYWNAEKNISVPMNKHILGDIVSIDEFGRYIFVARNEDILKIRGYRYTPQYIEDMYKALLLSDMVKEMVVFVQNEQPQIACAISIEDFHALRETLPQAFLTLPHWLRPRTAYFFAQELPKTPRGKLSRKWIANLCQHHPTRQNLS